MQVLVGCKSDLQNERQVKTEEGKQKAQELGERHGGMVVPFFEVFESIGY